MSVTSISRPALVALLLAACVEGPATTRNPHTGVTAHRSSELLLQRSPAASAYVRGLALSAEGATRFALLTRVVRADGNYPKIESAWSLGKRLPYSKGDRRRVGCGTATGCRREEVGSIPLPRAAFEAAAAGDGMTLQLVGRRGTYTGHVPARAFADVIERQSDTPVDNSVHRFGP